MKISHLLLFLCCMVSIVIHAQVKLPDAYPGNTKYNIVRTWDAQAPVTDPTVLITKEYMDVRQYIIYYDGLGRIIQSVQRQGSMVTGASAKDLVTPTVYDAYGREVYKYLPFVANNTGTNTSISDGKFKYNAFQQDSAFLRGMFTPDSFYYSKKLYEPSPLNRILDEYAVGNSWSGSESNADPSLRRGTMTRQRINTVGDSVRIWTVNGTAISTTSIFPANQLYKLVTTDEHKKETVEYKNKEGQVVLKKVQLADMPTSGHQGWLCTYYVYDYLNRLRLIIQPRGVELLMANAWNLAALSGDILNEQCFRYDYDTKGRMIVLKVPGVAEVRKVYDGRDRVVLQQDGNLRANNQWIFTKYDLQNRPIITGFYTNSSQTTQAAMQTFVNGQNLGYFESYPTGSFPYYSLNQTFPVITDTSVLLTVSWFDDYSWSTGFSGFSTKDNSFDNQFAVASNSVWPYPQPLASNVVQTQGLPTGNWDKAGGAYLVEGLFYDDYGRVIQRMSKNISGGIDIATTQFSFNGKVLQTHLRHQKLGNNTQTHAIITKTQYDSLWRVLTIKQSINSSISGNALSSAEKTIVSNEYNALGQLSKMKLGTKPDNSTPLSNHDYEYNIRGWITSINKGYLTTAQADRYFGFQLGYDKNGVLGTFTPQYNINVSGVIWKNEADKQVRKYDFFYDAAERFLAANFNQYVSGSGVNAVFDKSAGLDFSVTSVSYDANGNIQTLNQKGWKLGGSNYIDSLKYTYYNSGNRLKNVIDLVNDTASRLGDFRSSKAYMTILGTKTNSATDYTYDANSNVITDRNKDVEDAIYAGVEYNHLNLPVRIRVKSKGIIEYTYDKNGNKIRKVVTEGTNVVSTLYIQGFEYKKDTLQYFQHIEGRVRLEAATVNTCPILPQRFVYDYYIKDHLTNIRVMLTEDQMSDCYIAATVEDARIANEQALYNIVPARVVTKAVSGATQTSFENKLYRTHGGLTNEKTGFGIVLKVMAGDQVAIRGESFYSLPGGNAGAPLTLALTELLTSFVGSGSAALKGVGATSDITGIPGNSVSLTSFLGSNAPPTNTAKAAINWILFDEQFKFVTGDFDGVLAGGGYKNHTKFVNAPAQIQQSGYIYIFVSNESNLPVYFDNLQLTHIRGPLLETTDYYPFGLAIAGTNAKANKANFAENRKKFVSQDYESELGWNTYQFKFRTQDPQTGRFLQVDPLSEKFEYNSTYAYAENKVTNSIDLEGLETYWMPIISNNTTILRGPIIENVVKPVAEAGTKMSETVGKTPKIEEHHIYPRQLKDNPVVQSAREGGFKWDGKENKVPLEKFDTKTGKGQHGSHPQYTQELTKQLGEFQKANPNFNPQQAVDYIRGSVNEIRQLLKDNPATKVNELFKSVLPPQAKDGILIGIPAPGSIGPKPKPEPEFITLPYV